MSVYQTKSHVDKNVSMILSKLKTEKERNSRGLIIARQYYEVKEYEMAKRYCALYLTVKEQYAPAHKLMGQIHEALGQLDRAVACYKKCLELDGAQKDLVLKICQLYSKLKVDPDVAKYWAERAERLFPNHEAIFQLKEQIHMTNGNTAHDLEDLLAEELAKRPTDVKLRLKLLKLYQGNWRINDAYQHAISAEKTGAYNSSLEWYTHLVNLFQAYKEQANVDAMFYVNYLSALNNLVTLSMGHRNVADCAEALYRFDQALYECTEAKVTSDDLPVFETEMEGQLFYHTATLLLKRSQQGYLNWKDSTQLATSSFLVSYSIDAPSARGYAVVGGDRSYQRLYDVACYRLCQVGHMLVELKKGNATKWLQKVKQQQCTDKGLEKLYDSAFLMKDMRGQKGSSYMCQHSCFTNFIARFPNDDSLREYEMVAHMLRPDSLHQLVWIGMQRYSEKDNTQPAYNFRVFDSLQYSTGNLHTGSAESLCQLDTEAFLYAVIRTCVMGLKERHSLITSFPEQPYLLPACICDGLVTKEQSEWWQAAYKLYMNKAKENFAKLRQTLQRGLEVIRLVGAHGMDVRLVAHLARTFEERVLETKAQGQSALDNAKDIDCLRQRAAHYWTAVIDMLDKIKRNIHPKQPRLALFPPQGEELTSMEISAMSREAKFFLAQDAIEMGKYEEALESLEALPTPEASHLQAKIYQQLAEEERDNHPEMENKEAALLTKARDSLYITLDRIRTDKTHALNEVLSSEIEEVESKLGRIEPDMVPNAGSSDLSDQEEAPSLALRDITNRSRSKLPAHSTPHRTRHGELDADYTNLENHGHLRPSPERLDAEIRSLRYSQESMVHLMMQRNEELVETNKRFMDQLLESQKRLADSQKINSELMEKMSLQDKLIRELEAKVAAKHQSRPSPIPPQMTSSVPSPYAYPPPIPGYPATPSSSLHYLPPPPPGPPPGTLRYPPPPGPPPGPPADPGFRGLGAGLGAVPVVPTAYGDDGYAGIDGETYEDDGDYLDDYGEEDGSMNRYHIPDSELVQDWPYGNVTKLEGKSTITYSPQQRPPCPTAAVAPNLPPPPPQQPQFYQIPAYLPPGFPQMQATPPGGMYTTGLPQIAPGFFSLPSAPGQVGLQNTTPLAAASHVKLPAMTAAVSTGGGVASPGLAGVRPAVPPATSATPAAAVTMPPNVVMNSSMSEQMSQAATSPVKIGGHTPYKMAMPAGGEAKDPATATTSSVNAPAMASSPKDSILKNLIMADTTSSLVSKPTSEPSSPTKGGHDDSAGEGHDESYNGADFEPVIPLPDLVETPTGEEDEDILFENRGKLYRFADAQWKERGTGVIKILHNTKNGKVRILMRRDQTMKVCANHYITPEMKLLPSVNNDKAWSWFGMDFADEQPTKENFTCRFKTTEIASQFKENFVKAIEIAKKEKTKSEKKTTTAASTTAATTTTTVTPKTDGTTSSWGAALRPPAGNWECGMCLVSNPGDKTTCMACQAPKPGSKPVQESTGQKVTGFSFGVPGLQISKSETGSAVIGEGGFKFGATTSSGQPTAAPSDSSASAVAAAVPSGGFKFGSFGISSSQTSGGESSNTTTAVPPTGGFKFGTVPAQPAAAAAESTAVTPPTGGLKFGGGITGTGLTFGKPAAATTSSWGFKFGTSEQPGGTTAATDGTKPAMTVTIPPASSSSDSTTERKGLLSPPKLNVDSKSPGAASTLLSLLAQNHESSQDKDKAQPKSDDTAKPQFGGFTFTSQPIVKQIEETSTKGPMSADTKAAGAAAAEKKKEEPKPFAGFSFSSNTGSGFTFMPPSTTAPKSTTAVKAPAPASEAPKEKPKQEHVFGENASGALSFTNLTDAVKTADAFKGKENFQGFAGAGEKVFGHDTSTQVSGGSPTKSPGRNRTESEGAAPEEFTPQDDFKPLVSLPEVEVKTGEEEEIKIFGERAKLYRFDKDATQWKERGVGEIKLLKQKGGVAFRVLMRREQVHKLCANHAITKDMELKPMSDRAWIWLAADFSEEEVKHEKLAVKFKNEAQAKDFKEKFEDCQKKIREYELSSGKETTPKEAGVDSTAAASAGKSLSNLFKPSPGSWECTGCYLRNNADVLQCPACNTQKPGTPTAPKPLFTTKPKETSQPVDNSLAEMFKPKAGSWECTGCYCRNEASVLKCPACSTLKPGVDPAKVESQAAPAVSFGTQGITSGGFTFGAKLGASLPFTAGKDSSKDAVPSSGQGFVFTSTPAITQPISEGFVFGSGTKPAPSTTSSAPSTGFVFGGSQSVLGVSTSTTNSTPSPGFVFGSVQSLPSASTSTTTITTSTSSTGFVFGQPQGSTGSTFGISTFSWSGIQPFTPTKADKGKSPVKSPVKAGAPLSPGSPGADSDYYNEEEDEHEHYFEPVIPLPDKIDVKTGEEEEDVLFCQRAKLFRFTDNEWKERGLGDMKVLRHKESKAVRLLMRREQVLKLCCNHYITPELDLKPMPSAHGKAWIWHAMDFSEDSGKHEKLAIKFRSKEIADEFKQVFEDARDKKDIPALPEFSDGNKSGTGTPNRSPSKSQQSSSFVFKTPDLATSPGFSLGAKFGSPQGTGSGSVFGGGVSQATGKSPLAGLSSHSPFGGKTREEEDEEVEFLGEELPSKEKIEMARRFLLPDCFYNYEKKPPCPGCIGCEDWEEKKKLIPKSPAKAQGEGSLPQSGKEKAVVAAADSTSEGAGMGIFGQSASGGFDFAALAAQAGKTGGAFGKTTESSKSFTWGGTATPLFQTKKADNDGEGDDDDVEKAPDVHFEPVVELPDLVDVKTGEEDEEVVFSHRAKLYRFDSNQWKERGVGEMKLLWHRETGKVRALLRREQVLKLACNHYITQEMELKPMMSSETAWCWLAVDFAGNEAKHEQFAVKFKTQEIAKQFKAKFEECQRLLSEPRAPTQESSTGKQDTPVPESPIVATTATPLGDKGNPYYTRELDTEAKEGSIAPRVARECGGDRGNWLYTRELDTEEEEGVIKPQNASECGPREVEENLEPEKASMTGGDLGNWRYTKELNVSAQEEVIKPSSGWGTGGGETDLIEPKTASTTGGAGNTLYSQELNTYAQEEVIKPSSGWGTGGGDTDLIEPKTASTTGGAGNTLYSQELDITELESNIIPTRGVLTGVGDRGGVFLGGRGSPMYSHTSGVVDEVITAKLDFATEEDVDSDSAPAIQEDIISSTQGSVTGGGLGNTKYTMELNAAAAEGVISPATAWQTGGGDTYPRVPVEEVVEPSSTTGTGGGDGNALYSRELDVEEAITPGHASITGDRGNPEYSRELGEDVDEKNEEEEEEDDDEDDEQVLFEKRGTLSYKEGDKWKTVGMGNFKVIYDDDVNGSRIYMCSDDDQMLCSHLILQEMSIECNEKLKTCTWDAHDFATDEAVRKNFRIQFSSAQAVKEFKDVFNQGLDLARESELSEKDIITVPSEIMTPEVAGIGATPGEENDVPFYQQGATLKDLVQGALDTKEEKEG